MKKTILITLVLLLAGLTQAQEGVLANGQPYKAHAEGWLVDINEAYKISKETGKPILANFTGSDWCGWCKVMDKKTFSQEEVASYLNDHFYPVKFNAEKEKPIELNGQQYEVVNAGKRGIHTLAYAMLDGRLSYPSYVILGGDMQRLGVIKGFKQADPFLSMLEDYQNKQ